MGVIFTRKNDELRVLEGNIYLFNFIKFNLKKEQTKISITMSRHYIFIVNHLKLVYFYTSLNLKMLRIKCINSVMAVPGFSTRWPCI